MTATTYAITGRDGAWQVQQGRDPCGDAHATKLAAFEAVVAMATTALRCGHPVVITVQGVTPPGPPHATAPTPQFA